MADIGHNSLSGTSVDDLRKLVERIERLEDEKATIALDIKDVYVEAKSSGFDVKTLRKLIALRRQDADSRKNAAALLETYAHALGLDLI